MGRRQRLLAAAIAITVHLAALGPLADGASQADNVFRPDAEAIEDGAQPYEERGFEYPPLALPVLVGPALVSDSDAGYREALAWEMIGFDLVIVVLLALAVPGSGRRAMEALAVYTAGVIALSGLLVLPDSELDAAPLALARFDLVPAALVLAALLARVAERSGLWSALLATATAAKAFPAVLYPNLLRGEEHPRRALLWALPPVLGAAALVLISGDDFGSAISYHSGRELQVETLAATPLEIAHLLGAGGSATIGAGSFNLDAPGAEAARAISLVLLVLSVTALAWQAWLRRADPWVAATAVLTAAVVFAPVLSPQFLLWLLPVSAVAYGLRAPNIVLVAALVVTEIALHFYDGAADLTARFVLSVAARNVLLLAYLVLVAAPLLRGSASMDAWRLRTSASSS